LSWAENEVSFSSINGALMFCYPAYIM